ARRGCGAGRRGRRYGGPGSERDGEGEGEHRREQRGHRPGGAEGVHQQPAEQRTEGDVVQPTYLVLQTKRRRTSITGVAAALNGYQDVRSPTATGSQRRRAVGRSSNTSCPGSCSPTAGRP